jgi:uncharacterized protein
MNRNQVLPQVELSSDVGSLRKVDLCAHQAYKGYGFLGIRDLPRVAGGASTVETGDGFHWKLETYFEKSPGSEPRQFMNLDLKGQIRLVCQRCLKDCPVELSEGRRFALVGSEDEANAFPIEDDQQEPLVASQHFDVLETIEDEILLSLPLIPKHPEGVCEAHASTFGADAGGSGALETRENPFNILKNMKKNS